MAIELESQEEIKKKSGRTPLLINDTQYIGYIASVREVKVPDYNDRSKIVDRIEADIMLASDYVGGPIFSDDSGTEPSEEVTKPIMITKWSIDPTSSGFQQNGLPSNFRALIAYTTGQRITERLVLDSVKDLEGKYIGVVGTHKTKKDGSKTNIISRFTKLPSNFVEDSKRTEQLQIQHGEIRTRIDDYRDKQNATSSVPAGAGNDNFLDV